MSIRVGGWRIGPAFWTVLAVAATWSARAQFPDVLSETECPGCVAAAQALPIEGVWSSALTAADAEWRLEDLFCVTACTAEARGHVGALLGDPRNAERPTIELYPELAALNVRKLGFGCDGLEFVQQVVSPLPLEIRHEAGHLVLNYEERGAVRSIALEAPGSAPHAVPHGASIGRVEGGALVVETYRVTGKARGAELRATERYSVSADGRWLDLVLEVRDADGSAQPLVVTKRWLRTPGARLAQPYCDVQAAGLEASFADYVDPRRIDVRRGIAR